MSVKYNTVPCIVCHFGWFIKIKSVFSSGHWISLCSATPYEHVGYSLDLRQAIGLAFLLQHVMNTGITNLFYVSALD